MVSQSTLYPVVILTFTPGQDDTRIFKRDFIPYVFTDEEICRIFRVLQGYCEKSPGYENDAFRMAMLLYYCCGFRKSEVLDLLMQDVDFQTGKICILNGKNEREPYRCCIRYASWIELKGY